MNDDTMLEKEISGHVIGAFFEVYNTLGPGFLERVYADAIEIELVERGRSVEREIMIPIYYKGRKISSQRADMIADGRVIVEIKSTSVLPVDADRQLTNYLRASPMCVGLLLHFGPKARFLRRVHTTITPGP